MIPSDSKDVLERERIKSEESRVRSPVMTFDEVSMERSKSFVKALQELKNLRPQLYSAAEYCEKSYLHSDQKQMVLDNLKDYAVQALVNAVDHLGTVASKLTDLVEQQKFDVSTTGLKVSRLNQQLLMCRTYMNEECLRQQQLLVLIPKHHKHYTLPNSVNKKVHFNPRPKIQTDARQKYFQSRSLLQPTDLPASMTLSWHLSESKSSLRGSSLSVPSKVDPKVSTKSPAVFKLLDNEESIKKRPMAGLAQTSGVDLASTVMMQTYGVSHKDMEGSKPLKTFVSLDKPRPETGRVRTPRRSKSVLSAFFAKEKIPKLKAAYVS